VYAWILDCNVEKLWSEWSHTHTQTHLILSFSRQYVNKPLQTADRRFTILTDLLLTLINQTIILLIALRLLFILKTDLTLIIFLAPRWDVQSTCVETMCMHVGKNNGVINTNSKEKRYPLVTLISNVKVNPWFFFIIFFICLLNSYFHFSFCRRSRHNSPFRSSRWNTRNDWQVFNLRISTWGKTDMESIEH
jgi:hypothetical protein